MFAGFIFNGCQPKDNKLAPVISGGTSPNSQGLPPSGFKIGSYGQPLVALQQIEQIGSMIQSCLNNENFACNFKMSDGSLGPQLIDQRWSLSFKAPVITKNIQGVQEITGELVSGQVFGKFKNELLQTEFISAEFTLKRNEDLSFNLEVMQNLKITNPQASEILLIKSTAKVLIQESVWILAGFNSKLYSLKQNKTILSAAEQVQLDWKNRACAEYSGLFNVQDGANKAQITVDGVSAVLTSASRTPWSQKLIGCGERQHSHQNYDFLFY
jgi:hypothetical protein